MTADRLLLRSFPTRRSSDLSDAANSWIRGLMVGHEFRKGSGLYLEFYDQADVKGTGGKPAARESTIGAGGRSEEHTSELQSLRQLVCRLLLEKQNRAHQPRA